jgi:Fuc2NAc and GlcNAc transferase
MGDAGSGYVGFALALGALGASGQTALTLWTWFILHGLFVVDATITLATRLFHHQRVFEPHRDHVYQRLTRRWQSHARVSSVFFAVNVLWLLPFAVLSVNRPRMGWLFTLGAWTPLIIGALGAGAGHSQGTPRAAPSRSS